MAQDVRHHHRRRSLNRQVIVAAARRVADSSGLAELTLRRVAGELGTGQASLYRHIADRAELLGLLAEDLATGFPLEGGRSGADGVVRQWEAMHDYLADHPWGARVIAEGFHTAAGGHAVAEHNLALLRAAGLDDTDAARAYRALWHLLLGHLLNEHPLGHDGEKDLGAPDFSWALRRLVTGMTDCPDLPCGNAIR
ncbi:helix-turn-helix domain-containing protein [Spongiactinospora sp. TRM90649]|uniref:TetR/AcrR family transcriptional regulator n=1 Tax=Spongiactinospora sp. TRM90649 TaxID=3031114 RepID=UPI0023F64F95|nr:helix-turn-helix domain-containing protein [Spongiactinospora sp. TRM90649]MDF5754484.1 helix-turn-helix domain containing protein [Spongiactinospora sp. TRM90649]